MNNEPTIWIIGCGCGNPRHLTRQAAAALRMSELLIGTENLLESLGMDTTPASIRVSNPEEVRLLVESSGKEKIGIAVPWNGEDGFGRAVREILAKYSPMIIPGLTPSAYLSAKTGHPSGDAVRISAASFLGNAAGTAASFSELFLEEPEAPEQVIDALLDGQLEDTEILALEQPGRSEERLSCGSATELAEHHFHKPVYMLLRFSKRESGETESLRRRVFETEDDLLDPLSLPREVRAVILRELQIEQGDTIYDIGFGNGLLVAELAYLTGSEGRVIAVDRNPEAAEAVTRRAEDLGLNWLKVRSGTAPAALAHIPAPDKAVLEGTDGAIKDLLQILISRNPHVRVTAVRRAVEGASEAVRLMDGMNFEPVMLEISCTRTIKKDGRHRLIGEPPFYLITGTHKPKDRIN